MRMPSTILAAAAVAAAIPLAGSALAAPISQPQAMGDAGPGAIAYVQWRGWDGGYPAYGAAPDGYGAVPDGYYAYGAAPRHRYAPRYRQWNYGNGSAATAPGSSAMCPADLEAGSGYPSWMCR